MTDINLVLTAPVKQRFRCQLHPDQIGVLLAPSGAGKTSLFQAIGGLSSAEGWIKVGDGHIDQIKLRPHQRQIAYVTQAPLLFSHLTINKLIALVAAQQRYPADIHWAIAPLKLQDKLECYAHHLSGGQKQRVALLLAMIKGAPLLLLDEALTGQDQATKQACIGVIKEYLKRHQGSALIACHQIEDAIALCYVALLQCDDNQEKYWQSIPIAQGIHQYQQQLIETNSCKEPSQSLVNANEFLSVLHATPLSHHRSLGLTEYRVAGQTCFTALAPTLACEQAVSLVLKANRVGLSRTLQPETSFVNQWQVIILGQRSVGLDGEQGILLDVALVDTCGETKNDNADRLSVWITRLSYNQLQPNIEEYWYLIGKADALSVNAN